MAKQGPGEAFCEAGGGVEVFRYLPDAGPRAFAAPAKGAGARSTTAMGPKKVYTLQKRQGSKNQPGPRGGRKKFIPSENATVTHNLRINFSGGRSAQSVLPDRALASRQQGRAGALAPVPSPTPGQVKPRAGADWRRSRSTRFESEFGRHRDGRHAPQNPVGRSFQDSARPKRMNKFILCVFLSLENWRPFPLC